MTENTTIVVTITGPGYTTDPFNTPEERAEGFFVGAFVGKFTGEKDGFLSTYREWHILLAGISAGARAKTLENVPECPPLWADEMQYFNIPAMVVNVIKCQWPTITLVIMGLTAKASGVINF